MRKEAVEFYLLLTEEDLDFIAKNNFTKLPCNEILFSFTKENIDKGVESLEEYKNKIIFIARIECDRSKLSDFEELFSTDHKSKFQRLSEAKINTINCSLDKIILENFYAQNCDNKASERVNSIIQDELSFFKYRLEIFLETASREVISHDYFYNPAEEQQNPQNFSDEEVLQQIKENLEKQESFMAEKHERIKLINSVNDAVDFLINEDLDDESIKNLKNKSLAARLGYFGGDLDFHFGYGMYFRNLFFYKNNNHEFLNDIENAQSLVNKGEFGEGIIYDLLWRKLNNYETTDENVKKIKDIENQIQDDSKTESLHSLYEELKLLSYNCTEEEIKKYLVFTSKMQDDDEDFEESYYQQKTLLARLNEEERKIFEKFKQDYFNIENILNKLNTNHE